MDITSLLKFTENRSAHKAHSKPKIPLLYHTIKTEPRLLNSTLNTQPEALMLAKTSPMIKIATCCIIAITSLSVKSQWTTDPNAPQLVSNASCTQNNVRQVADESGGTFVFWKDGRIAGCNSGTFNDVYGQHYNSDGIEQWESGGRKILDYSGTITAFDIIRSSDGEMVIGSITNNNGNQDSLRFQLLDDQGAKLWVNDLLVARSYLCAAPYYTLGFATFNFLRDTQGYTVSITTVYCGGATGNRITRFNSAGILTGPYNGEAEGTQFNLGSPGVDRTYDGSNDAYIFYSDANGAGAHAHCLRVNLMGDTVWGPTDVVGGTNGLSYQFRGMSDESGIAFCFETIGMNGTSGDLMLHRFHSDGSLDYTTSVSIAPGFQGGFDWKQDNDFYYICWADSRPGVNPGNFDVYAQKINKTTGVSQWALDGIEVFSQPNYTPAPECTITADGEMIICALASIGSGGFNAQMLSPDGALNWSPTFLIDDNNYLPFYNDYQLIISGSNVMVAWSETNPSGGADGIYISRFFQLDDPCFGDFNNDNVIATTDILLFMGAYGCSSNCSPYDLTGDDMVTTSDFLVMVGLYGTSCP